jgi:hypothetical protein
VHIAQCVFAGTKRFFIVDARHRATWENETCGWVDSEWEKIRRRESNTPPPPPPGAKPQTNNDLRLEYGYGSWAGRINVSAVDLVRACLFPPFNRTIYSDACLFLLTVFGCIAVNGVCHTILIFLRELV